MLLSTKDPSESVTVTFDFSALTSAVSNPSVAYSSVGRVGDSSPSAIQQTPPAASGAKVLVQVFNGISGAAYLMKCSALAADGISIYTLVATLPVNSL
jgi:hypothetical protein